jgi:hypothetical protein
VAVGDVVNQLPVGINIESVPEGWRDQSGKYWIGNQEPKLCFCRILRSQTVMVRVGGGWTELSKSVYRDFPFSGSFRTQIRVTDSSKTTLLKASKSHYRNLPLVTEAKNKNG